jgi:hypothetical protein
MVPELLVNESGTNGLYYNSSTQKLKMTQSNSLRTVFMVDLYKNNALFTETSLGGPESFDFRSDMKKGQLTCTISFISASGQRLYIAPTSSYSRFIKPSNPGNLRALELIFTVNPYEWWITSLCSELCEHPIGYRIKDLKGEFHNILGAINYDQSIRNADMVSLAMIENTDEMSRFYESHDKLANIRFFPV